MKTPGVPYLLGKCGPFARVAVVAGGVDDDADPAGTTDALSKHLTLVAVVAGAVDAAAARSGLSLVWKIVLIVELLGRPNGVGFEIGVAFQLFDVTKILTYALAFVAVMLLIETFLVQPLERHVSRWRPRTA